MILQVDMDGFHAADEERDRPELVGKPVNWNLAACLIPHEIRHLPQARTNACKTP